MKPLLEMARARAQASGDPSHDFLHLLRVVKNCIKIGKILGADLEVLVPAALLHDIINVPKNHPDRTRASAMAAAEAQTILKQFNYSDDQVLQICTAITEHSFSAGKRPSSLESAILQDSDRLDAIGAIGVARTFTCGAKLGSVYYDLNDPVCKKRSQFDDKKFTVDHFFLKLLKLSDQMNTEPAKAEARKRADFMRSYLKQLEDEVMQSGTESDWVQEVSAALP